MTNRDLIKLLLDQPLDAEVLALKEGGHPTDVFALTAAILTTTIRREKRIVLRGVADVPEAGSLAYLPSPGRR